MDIGTYSRASKNKLIVAVSVQFFKLGDIDTRRETFSADVIVRSRWRAPELDGHVTGDIQDITTYVNPKLYIENAAGNNKVTLKHQVITNERGEAFISEKRTSKGTFMETMELNDFPFDVQDLTITVASDLPINEVEIIEDADAHNMVNTGSFFDGQEFHLYAHTEACRRELHLDEYDPGAKRSALSVKCRAARRAGYFVWKFFMVTFLIFSLSFATFSVHKSHPEARLKLSFTLLLTTVAFKNVVHQSLPRISYLTYMDKYLLASLYLLSAMSAWHAAVPLLVEHLGKDEADYIEHIVFASLGGVYALYNIAFCVMIYMFPCRKRRMESKKDRSFKKIQLKRHGATNHAFELGVPMNRYDHPTTRF